MKCALAGCDQQPTTLTTTGHTHPSGLAVDATDVYWTEGDDPANGSLKKCAVGGCGQAPTTVVPGGVSNSGLVVDATTIYWTTTSPSPAGGGSLWSCPSGACAPAKLADSTNGVTVQAVSPTTLMGTFTGSGVSQESDVWTCSPTACAPKVLASNASLGAMDTTNAYFEGGPGLQRCALAGCGDAPTTLVSGGDAIQSIATDGVSVYFATVRMDQMMGVAGAVLKCPVGGCNGQPTTIAELPCKSSPGGLAVDATHVYWRDGSAGLVLKAPK
jgi:hypothetical protein